MLLASDQAQLMKAEELPLYTFVEVSLGFAMYARRGYQVTSKQSLLSEPQCFNSTACKACVIIQLDVRHPCDPASHRSKDLKRTRILEMVGESSSQCCPSLRWLECATLAA
ncbi:hypothetical protein, conserved, partial [Eimeria acervulina]